MIRKFAVAMVAALAIGAMVASPAEAGGGGGGAKGKNGTVRVLGGQTGGGVGLILLSGTQGPPGAGYPTIAALQAAGGQVINPDQVLQFKVAGPGNAYVGAVTSGSTVFSGTAGYSGAQNQTGYMKVSGTDTAPSIAGAAGVW